jgi:hypothetical protein
LDPGLLSRVVDKNIVAKTGQHSVDSFPQTIGGYFNPEIWAVGVFIGMNFIEDLEEFRMQGGLSTQEADPFPLSILIDAFFEKTADLVEADMVIGGGHSARTVAVKAVEVAGVGDINFDVMATAFPHGAGQGADGSLHSRKIVKIVEQCQVFFQEIRFAISGQDPILDFNEHETLQALEKVI